MNFRSFPLLSSLAVSALVVTSFACSSGSSSTPDNGDGGSSSGGSSGGGSGSSSGTGSSSGSSSGAGSSSGSGSSSGTGSSSGSGSSSGGKDGGTGSGSGSGGGSGSGSGGGFPAGTICNSSGKALTPPGTLKNIIVIMLENQDFGSVNTAASVAPYINSLAGKCGVATAYNDTCFSTDLVSSPHYLALASGSNCNTGVGTSGTGCITDDNDPSSHTLTTKTIFDQVTSWKAYQENMAKNCDGTSAGDYAAKHNPAVYFPALSSCATNDVPIAELSCSATATMTPCTPAPSNAFTTDLANDTLPQFSFVTPSLVNDMHNAAFPGSTITKADNWLFTYLPLIFQSKAYLRGDVAVQLIWDEQGSFSGGPTPNVFISPYITAGTTSGTVMNHYSLLRSWEKAFGISTFLGCASGTPPGGTGTCPAESTADVRAALNW